MPELTVASTTDTDADVKLAANVPLTSEPEPESEPEPKPEPKSEEPEDKPQAKSNFQKRIDRLTRERFEAERKAQALEEKLRQYEQPEPEPVTQPPQSTRQKPKADDVDDKGVRKYATYEDFVEDLADWKVEQREQTRIQAEAQEAWEKQHHETVTEYNRKVTDFKKEHPDFDDVINQEIMLPQVALDTIVDLRNPAIGYYLGQHPEVCKELANNVNRPGWVAARIGQIHALTSEKVTPEPVEPAEPEPEPVPIRRSAAPAPIKPVGGSSTRSSVPLDELPYSEYRKLRDQQAKARYRR